MSTHQDVQGTLRAVSELFDGGEHRQDEAGEDQQEAGREESRHHWFFFENCGQSWSKEGC